MSATYELKYARAKSIIEKERLIFGDQQHINAVELCELVAKAKRAAVEYGQDPRKIDWGSMTASAAQQLIGLYASE
jgi:hypothetical protein